MDPDPYFNRTLPQTPQEIRRTIDAKNFYLRVFPLFVYVAHWSYFWDFTYSLLFVFIYFCLWVCVVYVYVHARMKYRCLLIYMHMCRCQRSITDISLNCFAYFLWINLRLNLVLTCLSRLAGQWSPGFISLAMELHTPALLCQLGPRDPDLGPHAYEASPLLIEPSTRPWSSFASCLSILG